MNLFKAQKYFPISLSSSLQVLTYIARSLSVTKNILLQNVLALLAPFFAVFLHQPPSGLGVPVV